MGFDFSALASPDFELPEGWRIVSVQNVAKVNEMNIQDGYEHSRIEYIDIASVEKGVVRVTQDLLFTDAPSRARRIVRDNDTLISTVRPNLEHYAFIKKVASNTVASTGFAVVTAKDVDPRWLYYFLTTKPVTEYLSRIADSHTSAYPAFNPDVIEKLQLPLPSPPEQRAIAHILGTLDDKIELNRRMNETLEAMAQAIFKSWFVDFDPVRAKAEGRDPGLSKEIAGLFPDSFEDSKLGEIPAGWEVKSISDLADVVGGSTPSTKEPTYWEGGVHHWATPKDLSGLSVPVLLDTERSITDAGLLQIGSGLLPKGTVLLSSRAPIGYLAIAELPVAINQGFIAMTPKEEVSNLFLILWASVAHEEILSRANGSTFLEISKSNFRPIPVVTPSAAVMQAFDRQARPLYERIVECERETRTLAAIRDTLLPKLLSGEIRAKTVVDGERNMAER